MPDKVSKKEYREKVRPTEQWFILQRAAENHRGTFYPWPESKKTLDAQ